MSISKERCMKITVVWAENRLEKAALGEWNQTLYCNNCSRASDRMMELLDSRGRITTILNLDRVARIYVERFEVDKDETV